MHTYPMHVGDYLKDTAHFDQDPATVSVPVGLVRDLAYRRLLDLYYSREQAIPNKTHWVATHVRLLAYADIVGSVLKEKFELREGHWHQKRTDEEIVKYQKRVVANQENGKKGGRKPSDNRPGNPLGSKPRTRTNTPPNGGGTGAAAPTTRGTRLPADWQPSPADLAFIAEKRPDLSPTMVADLFRDHWTAKGGKDGIKLDWAATWRNWVRSQRTLPAATDAKGQKADWWESKKGLLDKGLQLAIPAPADEHANTWASFKASVWVAAGDGPWWDQSSVAYPIAVRLRDQGGALAATVMRELSHA